MTTQMVTSPTGSSLQRLAEQSWERTAAGSQLFYEDQHWTGIRLAERSQRLAGGLREAGLRPGERVVICMANCPEVSVSYHAVWRAGAVATPVLFLLSEDELRHVLSDSGAVLAITTPEFLPKVAAAAAGLAGCGHRRRRASPGGPAALGAERPDPAAAAVGRPGGRGPAGLIDSDPAALAALLYTGGTTGRSKGVMITHDALAASAWAAASTSYDPAHHGPADPAAVARLRAHGQRDEPAHARPGHHGADALVRPGGLAAAGPGAPGQHQPAGALDAADAAPAAAGGLRPVRAAAAQQRRARRCPRRWPRTWSGGCPTSRSARGTAARRRPPSSRPPRWARPGAAASGRPAAGVQVRIERPDGTEADPGEDGEICVRGPMVMTGYWNAPAETEQTLRGGWLHTGDVGRLDDGYLYIVDRIKDLIIRGGYNVYPRDVEDVLVQHPDVVAAAVVGRPDPKYGEEVVAFVQLRAGAEVSPADLVAFSKEHLSAVKYPREVRVIDAIPLTSVLKTDRKRLRACWPRCTEPGSAKAEISGLPATGLALSRRLLSRRFTQPPVTGSPPARRPRWRTPAARWPTWARPCARTTRVLAAWSPSRCR